MNEMRKYYKNLKVPHWMRGNTELNEEIIIDKTQL